VGKARFGVIEFAVSADVTEEFRKAARAVAETDWQPLYRTVEGQRYRTDQEFAEVCFVPAWAGHSRRRADYRFLAIREPLRQLDLANAAQLPFPTEEFAARGRFKLFGLVTNRTLPGDQVIWWLRERCGKSEEVHAVMNWPDAERAVRGQRRVDHDPGPQPECRNEAAGAGAGVGRTAHEGTALFLDQSARPDHPPRPPPDHPGRRRDAGAAAVRPPHHPCPGAERMTPPSPDSTDDSSAATPAFPALASGPAPASRLVPATKTRKMRSRASHCLTMPAPRPAPTEERALNHLTTLSLPAVIRDPGCSVALTVSLNT
jgi:hypothetical protein